MDELEIARIACQVADATQLLVAIIGMVGVFLGSAITILGNFALEWFKQRTHRKAVGKRKKLLEKMLQHDTYPWRSIETLSAIIGCTEEATKDLLIAIDARGSEKKDGKWGLIAKHPLKNIGG